MEPTLVAIFPDSVAAYEPHQYSVVSLLNFYCISMCLSLEYAKKDSYDLGEKLHYLGNFMATTKFGKKPRPWYFIQHGWNEVSNQPMTLTWFFYYGIDKWESCFIKTKEQMCAEVAQAFCPSMPLGPPRGPP